MHAMDVTHSVVDTPSTFYHFTERYYHHYVVRDCKGVDGNNCRLLVHSNGLCVLCLDESHAAIQSHCRAAAAAAATGNEPLVGSSSRIESVAFGSGRGNAKLSPESIRVVGKRKKNAIVCQEDTNICAVTMTDGTLYKIPACVPGFVLELNPAVQDRPELLVEAPMVEGFIAVISPNYNKVDMNKFTKVSEATGGDVIDDIDDECVQN